MQIVMSPTTDKYFARLNSWKVYENKSEEICIYNFFFAFCNMLRLFKVDLLFFYSYFLNSWIVSVEGFYDE